MADINPSVSIVVPVYNTEKYLSESMRSLCAQTLKALEIICVDDCSTDNSLNILRDFAARDPRVRVITNRRNLGAAGARKRGMQESRGEFLMFADSDDLLLPNCCERALELIRQNQCDILQFNIRLMNGDVVSGSNSTFEPYRGRIEKSPLIEPWLNEIKFAHTLWGKIYRGDICRKAAEQMTNRPFNCALEDYYIFFLISYFSQSYVGVPEESLYIYREWSGINSDVLQNLRSVQLLPYFEDFLRQQGTLESERPFINSVAARLYDNGLAILLKTGNLKPAMFQEAVRCWGPQILFDFIRSIGVFDVNISRSDSRLNLLPTLTQNIMILQNLLQQSKRRQIAVVDPNICINIPEYSHVTGRNVIMQFATKNLLGLQYIDISRRLSEKYAVLHDFDYVFDTVESGSWHDILVEKLQVIFKNLSKISQDSYLIYIDTDAFITMPEFDVRDFIDQEHEFFIGYDESKEVNRYVFRIAATEQNKLEQQYGKDVSLFSILQHTTWGYRDWKLINNLFLSMHNPWGLNSGFIIIKSTEHTRKFFSDCINYAKADYLFHADQHFGDQDIISYFLQSKEYLNMFKILPHNTQGITTHPPDSEFGYKEGETFLLHMYGQSTVNRNAAAQMIVNNQFWRTVI